MTIKPMIWAVGWALWEIGNRARLARKLPPLPHPFVRAGNGFRPV